MKVVLQRVSKAKVSIEEPTYETEIDQGFVILLGIEVEDDQEDADWLVRKIVNMRIFSDSDGKMNDSILDHNGSCLIISQFTLHASTKKGNRPSFIRAARPNQAIPLYEYFIEKIKAEGIEVKTGVFGADMDIELVNNGPVTIIIDSKNKE